MIRSENKLKNVCASAIPERSIHTTIVYYEFSPREPKCINGVDGRRLGWSFLEETN